MEDRSIFTDIRDFGRSVKNGFGQLSSADDYVKTAYYDNPNHIYDNLLRFFWIVLYLCAGASLFFGVSYHYKLFIQTGQEQKTSIGLAILLFLIAEIISVFIGVSFFRYVWTGKLVKSFQHLVFFAVMGVLIYMSFAFRMDISAKAYGGQTANEQQTELAEAGISKAKANMKSSYDDEIKDVRATIAKGRKQTWGGKITPKGEYMVSEGNKTLQKYLDLRARELDMNFKADSVLNHTSSFIIFANQKQLNGYGGLVEWAVLILTCLIALLEKISYIENKKDEDGGSGEGCIKTFGNPIQSGSQIGFSKSSDAPNIRGRTPIGFKQGENIIHIPPPIIDIEKKTLVEPIDKKKMYENIIDGYNVLIELAIDEKKISHYQNIIDGYKILIELL